MANQKFTTRAREGKTLIIAVVGQVPPPVTGQSLMIREFLEGNYERLRLLHIPMVFSRSTSEIGLFGMRKLLHLFAVLGAIVNACVIGGASILYYPPAGANLNPVLRDLCLLLPTRWMFRHTVFHFHATGLSNIFSSLPRLLRPLFMRAYGRPDLAIFTTKRTSSDGAFFNARSIAIVPCGTSDPTILPAPVENTRVATTPSILFAGILCEEKGVLVLLEACRILRDLGKAFSLVCLGAFRDRGFHEQVEAYLNLHRLQSQISFPGVLSGTEKHQAFLHADLFCFPSHYPAESFGVVLIEAMSYGLPIIATNWQGIPEVMGEEAGTTLVPPRDPVALAASLDAMLSSPARRRLIGLANRKRYLDHFTLEKYRSSLASHLYQLSSDRKYLSSHLPKREEFTG